MKFEFMVAGASNSGVKYRSKGNTGMEYQMIDDINSPGIKKPEHKSTALYDLVTALDTKKYKPAKERDSDRTVANGNKIKHYLNSQKVVAVDLRSPVWTASFENSKYKDNPNFAKSARPIFLQDHKDEVSFRNIFIKELSINNEK